MGLGEPALCLFFKGTFDWMKKKRGGDCAWFSCDEGKRSRDHFVFWNQMIGQNSRPQTPRVSCATWLVISTADQIFKLRSQLTHASF